MVVRKVDWNVRLSIWLLTALVFVFSTAATMAAWWAWGPTDVPFRYINHEEDKAYVDGNGIVLQRTLKVDKRVEVHVNRELVQRDGAFVTKITLPESRAIYEPGEHKIVRVLEIPAGVRPGTYLMMNTAHWRMNPMREGVYTLPPIRVEIPAQYGG